MEINDNAPKVAIVILNWNGKLFLEKFLPFVLKTEYENFEVYVADNHSSDGSIDFLKNNFPDVQTIILDKNYGFAEGYNRSLKRIDSDYFVLLNSDVEVTPDWVTPIIKLMESDSTIAACQPKIRSFNDREYFEYAGAAGGWIDRNGYAFCRGRIFDTCEKDEGQYENPMQVFWASGAALFVRTEVYNHCHGFDNYFFAHQEEIDLCWRMQNAGYKVYVQPASVVFHLGGGSLARGNRRKIFLNFRNNLVMLHKNLNRNERFRKISVRLMMDGMAGIQFMLKGQLLNVITLLKAHGAYYSWAWHYKGDSGPRKRLKNMNGVFCGSIVWLYFLRKARTFSQIIRNKK